MFYACLCESGTRVPRVCRTHAIYLSKTHHTWKLNHCRGVWGHIYYYYYYFIILILIILLLYGVKYDEEPVARNVVF